MNTGCTSDAQVSAKHNTQLSGPAIYTDNPDSHLIQTEHHPYRPWSKPPTHSPPTPPTSPQPKYRHTSNTPPVPTGFVKSRPNPFIHSPHSPPTAPQAKHIHISHTPPTPHIPHTTLIHNTSDALDTIPEPRVPPTCPALTIPHPSPTPSLPSTSHHHTLSADTHATKQQYTHHRNHLIHIGYHDKLTDRPSIRRPHDPRHNTRTQTQK